MKKDKSAAAEAVKLSDEELSRKVKHYETIERIGGVLVVAVFIVGVVQALLQDGVSGIPLLVLMIILGIVIMKMIPMRAEEKKNALLIQQLGGYFYGELARMFGPEPENPEMPIDKSFLKSTNPVRSPWEDCRITDFHEGVRNGMRFSAANVLLSRRLMVDHPEDSGTYISGAFYGVVLRCRDVCGPVTDIVLRDRSEFEYVVRKNGIPENVDDLRRYYPTRKDGGLYDPVAFSRYYSAHTSDGKEADDAVTPQLRELIGKLEVLTANGRVAAFSLHNGELMLALHTSYTFSCVPDKQDLKDINGIRMSYTASLTAMAALLDLIRESCAEM
ncbi:MAG: hypothetical protein ACI4OB_03505 [Christensenellales bacterium]